MEKEWRERILTKYNFFYWKYLIIVILIYSKKKTLKS